MLISTIRMNGKPVWLIMVLLAVLTTACTVDKEVGLLNNPTLKTIKPGYMGNPYKAGQFSGPYTSTIARSFLPILKWKLSKNPKAEAKKNDTRRLMVHTPILPQDPKQDFLLWLGHASFYLRLNGKTVLIDPCLSTSPFYRRYVAPPLGAEQLPADYVLLSHGHYDHLDRATLRSLPDYPTTALLPLGMGALVRKMNPRLAVQEAGWYQQYELSPEIEIYLLPAHHWHRRTPYDMNRVLWGSFLIRAHGVTVYFAGDTSLNTHFKEIGRLFPDIDYALLPIGAYDPAMIMKDNHMNPVEALQAFKDLGAKTLVPMHYGTFDLTDEPVGEPLEWFEKEVRDQGLENRVHVLPIGEVFPLASQK